MSSARLKWTGHVCWWMEALDEDHRMIGEIDGKIPRRRYRWIV